MNYEEAERYRHFILEDVTETEDYVSPQQRGSRPNIPERNRVKHGAFLQRQIADIRQKTAEGLEGLGLQLEFESFPGIELAFESLTRERSGIELLNVRREGNLIRATVFVPEGKLKHFEDLIRDYLAEKRDRIGRARDNRRLLDAIQHIRSATIKALWTDTRVFPTQPNDEFWWEVWIRIPFRQEWHEAVSSFRECAEASDIVVARGHVVFPERCVLLVKSSVIQMQTSMLFLNHIAELRRAKDTAEFFDSMTISEQQEWLDDLLNRTSFVNEAQRVPYVCLLDTGVNRGHPLLASAIAPDDIHTVDPNWGTNDSNGHGTEMAGLALMGDLKDAISDSQMMRVEHRLESVKLLPKDGATGTDPDHHGYLTREAAARAEITAPFRRRVLGIAVTTRDNRDRGTPSAWSATLDALASDVSGQAGTPRLIVVSAGNTDPIGWLDYPNSNDTDAIHDPAQAWNVLTVGAYTDLVHMTEPDATRYVAIAPVGGLSPFSTTSLTWHRELPLKPDIVLEGGNSARDSLGPVQMPSLSLLTTHSRPAEKLFSTTNATSAATALASRMAAQIMVEYPEFWPETTRALIVHSAEWTDAMKRTYLPPNPAKRDYQNLLRRCGFGVPDVTRALWTARNSLTMVLQNSLTPFKKEKGKAPSNREMHVHQLPWPQDVLEELGETTVEMRVTLSYFIQPNPSRRGRSRYRYESHGLRFEVKRPFESLGAFQARINAAARSGNAGSGSTEDDPFWLIGKQGRNRGSLHGDIWRGSAADLASRGCMAVYPSVGWWRSRPGLKQHNRVARYSLVVSIRGPETDVDLYAEVANQIAVEIGN